MAIKDMKLVWVKLTGSSFAIDPNMTDKKYRALKPEGYYKCIECDYGSSDANAYIYNSINSDELKEIAMYERSNVWNDTTRDTLVFFDKATSSLRVNLVAGIGAVNTDFKIDGTTTHPSQYLLSLNSALNATKVFSIKAQATDSTEKTISIYYNQYPYQNRKILDDDFKLNDVDNLNAKILSGFGVIAKDSNDNISIGGFSTSSAIGSISSTNKFLVDIQGSKYYPFLQTDTPYIAVVGGKENQENHLFLRSAINLSYDKTVGKYATKVNDFSEILTNKGEFTLVKLYVSDSIGSLGQSYSLYGRSKVYTCLGTNQNVGNSNKKDLVKKIKYHVMSLTTNPKYIPNIEVTLDDEVKDKVSVNNTIKIISSINNGKCILGGTTSDRTTGTLFKVLNGKLYSRSGSFLTLSGVPNGSINITDLTPISEQICKKTSNISYADIVSNTGWSEYTSNNIFINNFGSTVAIYSDK